ncbi:UNKNOWN [Stylonychia lemnae]|uniref:Uncharacterized protein n=1 Tax=Stylonychia lemnae TaxID=5949 RepID=A0A078AE42_STYLE|nr:UNKNOWN [Stylonychia lemnae]|eukprot:CDW79183.1 UNKNOWN [Stylonychia lemnae]
MSIQFSFDNRSRLNLSLLEQFKTKIRPVREKNLKRGKCHIRMRKGDQAMNQSLSRTFPYKLVSFKLVSFGQNQHLQEKELQNSQNIPSITENQLFKLAARKARSKLEYIKNQQSAEREASKEKKECISRLQISSSNQSVIICKSNHSRNKHYDPSIMQYLHKNQVEQQQQMQNESLQRSNNSKQNQQTEAGSIVPTEDRSTNTHFESLTKWNSSKKRYDYDYSKIDELNGLSIENLSISDQNQPQIMMRTIQLSKKYAKRKGHGIHIQQDNQFYNEEDCYPQQEGLAFQNLSNTGRTQETGCFTRQNQTLKKYIEEKTQLEPVLSKSQMKIKVYDNFLVENVESGRQTACRDERIFVPKITIQKRIMNRQVLQPIVMPQNHDDSDYE